MKKTPVSVTTQVVLASSSCPMSSQKYLPAIWARFASTMIPATATPQPPIHPVRGPKAFAAQVKVVPQSGTARLSSR